jgi:hypothetical protein
MAYVPRAAIEACLTAVRDPDNIEYKKSISFESSAEFRDDIRRIRVTISHLVLLYSTKDPSLAAL